ncbi:hypothetical protein COV20_03350 [Candidatus Woesearchaeota archaeon CG10_big_fil_rev_8_21_14_0_10_45_16]|nr:MAG: hypothetical protein COV20_03350 [Candidatus Woesearchaeota archaeon CG10_big_fil_rev_8_21_14_0_10_45_16]
MDKQQVKKALEELNKQPKKKFTQSYDLVINLKNIVIKQNPVDFFATLQHPKGKPIKTACFVDQQLADQAQQNCDLVIKEADFSKYQDKKALKKLAKEYDYFIAQATLMPKVAAAFGKVLGMHGKMPNPKLGCVVPPNATLEPLVDKLRRTVRLSAKKGLNLQCMVGKEDQPQDDVIDNVLAVYQATVKQLPSESQNIRNVALKLTMGKPVVV